MKTQDKAYPSKANARKNRKKKPTLTEILKAVRINENGEVERCFTLRVGEETIAENGQRSEIVYVRIGARRYPCKLIWLPAKQYEICMRVVWADVKAADRELRCLLPNGKGGYIRCPDCNSCYKCDRVGRSDFSTNHPASLDELFEDANYEPNASYMSDFTVVETMELLDMLIAELTEKAPEYGRIFLALFNGIEKPREIAEELDLPVKRIYKDVPKVRKLAQEIYQRLTTI